LLLLLLLLIPVFASCMIFRNDRNWKEFRRCSCCDCCCWLFSDKGSAVFMVLVGLACSTVASFSKTGVRWKMRAERGTQPQKKQRLHTASKRRAAMSTGCWVIDKHGACSGCENSKPSRKDLRTSSEFSEAVTWSRVEGSVLCTGTLSICIQDFAVQ